MPVTAIILALTVAANAAPKRGDTSVEILGGWAMEDGVEPDDYTSVRDDAIAGGDLDGWLLAGGISWFTSDRLQIGIAAMTTSLEADNVTGAVDFEELGIIFPDAFPYDVDSEVSLYGAGGRARWYLNEMGKLQPYIGIQGFWVTGDVEISGVSTSEFDPGAISASEDTDGLLWAPLLGATVELSASNKILIEYQYHMWEGDVGDVLDSGHAITVGFAHTLK
jgi:hypothetical protein